MTGADRYPCPCDGCDSYSLSHDEYCVKCMHHGCSYEVKCR